MSLWSRTPLALCIAQLQADVGARHKSHAPALVLRQSAAAAPAAGAAAARTIDAAAAAATARTLPAAGNSSAAAAAAAACASATLSASAAATAAAAASAGDNSWGWRMHDAHDFFEEDSDLSTAQAMMAGAAAGVSEHVVMFPVDTLKTRIQEAPRHGHPQYRGLWHTFQTVKGTEGVGRLYRGVGAVVLGAIPSHAVHFAMLEFAKLQLGISDHDTALNKQKADAANAAAAAGGTPAALAHTEPHAVRSAAAGACAALAHDAMVTPADTVKQRLQMWGSSYRGIGDAIARIAREEGVRAFYASYPTTVLMNVPHTAVTVATYDTLRKWFSPAGDVSKSGTGHTLVAGGCAGALAAAVTTPLDVIKTRVQLWDRKAEGHAARPLHLARDILRVEGWRAFTKGMSARVVFNMPSAAICWTTYETVKTLLKATA